MHLFQSVQLTGDENIGSHQERSVPSRARSILCLLVMCILLVAILQISFQFDPQDVKAKSITSGQCHVSSSKNNATNPQTLSVRGTMDLTNSSIKLDPFMVLPGSKYTIRPANSSFTIGLQGIDGKNLAVYPFNPKEFTSMSNKAKIAAISEAVPYNVCTKKIIISKDNVQLASRTVDNFTPNVKILFPAGGENLQGDIVIRWQGSDADGDTLTYFVLYSTDAGKSWQTIASDIKSTQLHVNLAGLPGSNRSLFRIIATDGVNTAISDSNSTFSVPSTSSVG